MMPNMGFAEELKKAEMSARRAAAVTQPELPEFHPVDLARGLEVECENAEKKLGGRPRVSMHMDVASARALAAFLRKHA